MLKLIIPVLFVLACAGSQTAQLEPPDVTDVHTQTVWDGAEFAASASVTGSFMALPWSVNTEYRSSENGTPELLHSKVDFIVGSLTLNWYIVEDVLEICIQSGQLGDCWEVDSGGN